jgi:predicted DNA-binding ArsR family transcriptional regulator
MENTKLNKIQINVKMSIEDFLFKILYSSKLDNLLGEFKSTIKRLIKNGETICQNDKNIKEYFSLFPNFISIAEYSNIIKVTLNMDSFIKLNITQDYINSMIDHNNQRINKYRDTLNYLENFNMEIEKLINNNKLQ